MNVEAEVACREDERPMRFGAGRRRRPAGLTAAASTAIATAIAIAIMIDLGGCASTAGIAPVAKVIPVSSLGLGNGSALALNATPNIGDDWWRGFGDTGLDDLVNRALAGNPALRVAQARLTRASAAVAGAQANQGPQVNATLDAQRQRFSATGIYPPPLGGGTFTLANTQIGASWDLDPFGRNRAAFEAAVGAQRAAMADTQAARILLASNVARAYVQLGHLAEQRELAQRSLTQREQTLALIRQRVQAGLDTTVELRQGEGALPESRQQIEQLAEQMALVRHALAALTAQAPDALDGLVPLLRAVQPVPIPATVPADLLGRRADVAAARWRVEAAGSDMQSAKAQFYPDINLAAFVGLSSIGLNQLLKSASAQYGAGPAISLPIFDAGRLRANLRGKAAEVDAAIEGYNGAVIDAVHDVADQISSLDSLGRQQAEQARAQAAAESAYQLALQRYGAGLGNYLTVLTAEGGVLNQRRLAADLKARVLDTQVSLIRALGGGYSGAPKNASTLPGASS